MRNGRWAAVFGNGYNNTESDGGSTTSARGDAVLYLEDSSIMGVIFQDARYAGPPNAFVMYILRRR
jgi:type IV pilus assembly protein PilY1